MTVTPQTNATLEEIAEALLRYESFCVCGHVNPDGDCLGSTLALSNALWAIGKSAVPLVADDAPLDEAFAFMPGFERIVPASAYEGGCDVFIVVDAPNEERIGAAACVLREKALLTVTVDHHAAPQRMSDLSYTDPSSASASLLVWDLVGCLGVGDDDDARAAVATCAYGGLLTDTGRFMFDNTDTDAFRHALAMASCGIALSDIACRLFQERSLESIKIDALAADRMDLLLDGRIALSWISLDDMASLGASKSDTENAINVIRSVRGVQVACLLKERGDGIRGSLRSKGGIDVSGLARAFGGGGHAAAAGFTLACSLDEARSIMASRLRGLLA